MILGVKISRSTVLIFGGTLTLIGVALGLALYSEFPKDQDPLPEPISQEIKFVEMTGTPADNYSPDERDQHCGSADAKSTQYIQEFEIPTPCTQPLSIITDSEDKIWIIQTNTGNLTMFDPMSEEFTEYENDQWTLKQPSMMWGIVYTPDNEIWFTDEANGYLWKFSIDNKTYSKFDFPKKSNNSYPQKMGYYEDNFVINDFTGNQIVFVNHNDLDNGKITYSAITTPDGFFTSQAAIDKEDNAWFVIWKYQKEANLVKTNLHTKETEQFSLPENVFAPNGVSVGPEGKIWIADTASSSFFKFDPDKSNSVEYITSPSPLLTFGNSSGLIKTPITRPYWNAFDSDGDMWFNQQTGNRLAVFDPTSESLIEYDIPSKNPKWADCGDLDDCGTSQSFGFAIKNHQIWFTEWVENNIGVLDTSATIPISLDIKEDEIPIKQGEALEFFVTVSPETNEEHDILLSSNANFELFEIKTELHPTTVSDMPIHIPVTIFVKEQTPIGHYKILLSSQLPNVSVSTYATIKVI